MNIAFKERLDKAGSNSYAELSQYQRDFYLNQAVETFLKERYSGTNFRKEAYEETQKRTDDIRGFVTKTTTTTFNNRNSYRPLVFSVDLPQDYMFFINSSLILKVGNCPEEFGYVQRINTDEIDRAYLDGYNAPKKKRVLEWMMGNEIYLGIGSNVSLKRYILEYISLPTLLVYDPALTTPVTDGRYNENTWDATEYFTPTHTHSEIVEIAVRKAIETIESPRLGTQQAILSEIE